MEKNTNIFDIEKAKRLSKKDNKLSIELKVLKINEEVGELTQAALAYVKAPNCSSSKRNRSDKTNREEVLEEGCDVINSTMNLLFNVFTDKEIAEMFNKKLQKWAGKI